MVGKKLKKAAQGMVWKHLSNKRRWRGQNVERSLPPAVTNTVQLEGTLAATLPSTLPSDVLGLIAAQAAPDNAASQLHTADACVQRAVTRRAQDLGVTRADYPVAEKILLLNTHYTNPTHGRINNTKVETEVTSLCELGAPEDAARAWLYKEAAALRRMLGCDGD